MKNKKDNIKDSIKVDKAIIGVVLASFLILAAGIFFVSRMDKSPKVIASEEAKARVVGKEYDWGNIKFNGGDVKKTFIIKNAGAAALKIANIKTSCMCTTAQVKINGELSPFFGMHSKSSWVGEVAPGKKAELEVIFDPAYHGPSGIGPITREVVLETNDSENKTITFKLRGNVVK